jgi:hypothetical protein
MSDYLIVRPAGDPIAYRELGAANGVAKLNEVGKLGTTQIPTAMVGGVVYQGTWNANTNVPVIPAAAVANNGWYYKVATGGATAVDGITDWVATDMIISNGVTWEKIDNTNALTVVDAINDNVTTTAPSQNAVFDALALKSATSHTHTSAGVTDAASAATVSVIVLRDAAGRTKFAASAAADDAVIQSEIADLGTATDAATVSVLAKRDAAGRAKFVASAAATDVVVRSEVIGWRGISAIATGTLAATDNIIGIAYTTTGTFNLTLPAAATANVAGKIFTIKDVDGNAAANNISITPDGVEVINALAGGAPFVMSTNGQTTRIYSTGTKWYTL